MQSLQRCAALPPAGPPFADALGDYHRFPRPSSAAAAAAAAPLAGGHGGFEEGIVVGTPVSRRFERAEQLLLHECLLFFGGLVRNLWGGFVGGLSSVIWRNSATIASPFRNYFSNVGLKLSAC